MAEKNVGVIVPHKELCVACSKKSPYVFNIFTKTGKKATGYDSFASFFGLEVQETKANWATYLCRTCRTKIETWKRIKRQIADIEISIRKECQNIYPSSGQIADIETSIENECQNIYPPNGQAADIETSIDNKCQNIYPSKGQIADIEMSIEKECQNSQPSTGQKRVNASPLSSTLSSQCKRPCHEDVSIQVTGFQSDVSSLSLQSANNNIAIPFNNLDSNTYNDTIMPSAGKQPALSVPLATRTRKGTVSYKSCALKEKLEPTVQSFANGSIDKTLREINKHYPYQVKHFIVGLIRRECRQFNKLVNSQALRANSPAQLQKFKMKKVQNEVKDHAPTFWAILHAAAENRSHEVKLSHVTIASCVLLNSRSTQLNVVQYLASILSYHHCMQKEGRKFLQSAGLSVSHTSLQNKLKAAQAINEARVAKWKAALEEQIPCRQNPGMHVMSTVEEDFGGACNTAVETPVCNEHNNPSEQVMSIDEKYPCGACNTIVETADGNTHQNPGGHVMSTVQKDSCGACNSIVETPVGDAHQNQGELVMSTIEKDSCDACSTAVETPVGDTHQNPGRHVMSTDENDSCSACNTPVKTPVGDAHPNPAGHVMSTVENNSCGACNTAVATAVGDAHQNVAGHVMPTLEKDSCGDCNTIVQTPVADALHPGMSLVIDNFDVEIKARDMTMDNRDQSKHYVQVMAVLDRVNVEDIPLHDPEPVSLTNFPNTHFLPNDDDVHTLREDFVHAMSLILIEHVPSFRNAFSGTLEVGFQHQHSIAMSKKSVVLPLGIYDRSENVTHELTEVMQELHKLVPGARPLEEVEQICDRDPTYAQMRPLPLGGDQLTDERVRAVHQSLVQQDTPEERLQGLLAHIEDFHEKMNNLELMFQKFYNVNSAQEGGTLYYLRNLIDRTNVSSNVKQHYHEVSDFVDLVTESHVIAAAMAHLDMGSIDSKPNVFPPDINEWDKECKLAFLKEIVREIIHKSIYHQLAEDVDNLQTTTKTGNENQQDHVFNYASNLMTYGLLRKVTKMTTAAGDGDRAVRNWKYALVAYHTTNKFKYKLEAFLFLAGVSCLLPPRLREQIKWCRFVNYRGGQYANVDGDEAMEMLNNLARKQVKMLGSNHSPELVMRIGKTIKFTSDIAKSLGRQVGVPPISRRHTRPSLERDRAKLLRELTVRSRVFHFTPGRSHPSFPNQPSSIFGNVDAAKLHRWLTDKKKVYARGRWAF